MAEGTKVAEVNGIRLGYEIHGEVAVSVVWLELEVVDLLVIQERGIGEGGISCLRVKVGRLIAGQLERCAALVAPDKLGLQ